MGRPHTDRTSHSITRAAVVGGLLITYSTSGLMASDLNTFKPLTWVEFQNRSVTTS